jgi:hypothetical protein
MPIVDIKRKISTPEEIRAQQLKDANRDRAAIDAKLAGAPAPAPDPNDFADEEGEKKPSPFVKFNYSTADYSTRDGALDKNAEYLAKCNLASCGFLKFMGAGQKPMRVAGPHYGGFRPNRGSLGDLDRTAWVGDKDPWIPIWELPLQNVETGEEYIFTATTKTARNAVRDLLRHYNRTRKQSNSIPVVQLRSTTISTFRGKMSVPLLTVTGSAEVAPEEAQESKPDFDDDISST